MRCPHSNNKMCYFVGNLQVAKAFDPGVGMLWMEMKPRKGMESFPKTEKKSLKSPMLKSSTLSGGMLLIQQTCVVLWAVCH